MTVTESDTNVPEYNITDRDTNVPEHSITDRDTNVPEHNSRFMHRIEADGRFAYIFPTHSFLKGINQSGLIMRGAASWHLKYAFQFRRNEASDGYNKDTYQGIGLAGYCFGNHREVGSPVAVYVFQGAPVVRFSQRLSLNYEWNFGLSFGWHPWNKDTNPDNRLIGSRVNAYLNAGFSLNWRLSRLFDMYVGIEGTHFSNGNTSYPNLGLNTGGAKAGLICYFDRDALRPSDAPEVHHPLQLSWKKRLSYDFTVYGSWHRAGYVYKNAIYLAPKAYPVAGFSFSPMYRVARRFKTGLSLDGVYDGGSRILGVIKPQAVQYGESYEEEVELVKPPFYRQLSLGISARGEFVMPYFSINFGLGGNVLNSNPDLKFFYQMLTLKVDVVKGLYLNIGYNLRNFRSPNYLMLGLGYRIGN